VGRRGERRDDGGAEPGDRRGRRRGSARLGVDNLRFFAGAARNLEGKASAEYVESYTSILRREPLGIAAGITPWNYPLMMVVWKLGPALAAANVQILKPAKQTPRRCSASANCRRRCFLPASST
jgi:acyl-CoA reductase-like NAD-dependent aldehyde dehydrogenase